MGRSRQDVLKNIDILKVCMMLLVVLGHSIALFLPGGWFVVKPMYPSTTLQIASSFINQVHIWTFAFCSGFVFYYVRYARATEKRSPFSEICHRAKRLLLPYVVFGTLWVLPIYLLFFKPDPVTVIKKFVFATNPEQLWFLVMLFVLNCGFTLISDKMNKLSFAKGLITVLFVYIGGYSLHGLFRMSFKFGQHVGISPFIISDFICAKERI